jgi:hypothetical protein
MKKLNLLNKIYLVILTGFIIATAIKVYRYHGGDRYYYNGGVTKPPTYPVFVNQCDFVLTDGSYTSAALRLDVNQHTDSWGTLNPTASVDRLLLPKALLLEYASYRDKKYYRDSIPLPITLIDSLFKTSTAKGLQIPLSNGVHDVMGLTFAIGIANNGTVLIWLRGKHYEKQLLVCHLKPKPPTGELRDMDQTFSGARSFDVFSISDDLKKEIAAGKDSHANYADSTTHYLEESFNQ